MKYDYCNEIDNFFFSIGTYPSCTCKEPLQYNKENNACFACPEKSTGTYPECECKSGFFIAENSACVECPEYSTGVCVCV